MIYLPGGDNIEINKLNSCFNDTTASYKYLWFISILEAVEDGKKSITMKEILHRIIANAWFPTSYFHLSFGGQDKIKQIIVKTASTLQLSIDTDKTNILQALDRLEDKELKKEIKALSKYVPHRFLSPWIGGESRVSELNSITQDPSVNTPYSLLSDRIEIRDNWLRYFQQNMGVLKAFCYWHFTNFLQQHNPNVPNIQNKLLRPVRRKNLKEQRDIWKLVFEKEPNIRCIYTQQVLSLDNYALDHFLPFQYVAHDLMWNLVPANPSINSSKSDKIPNIDLYLNPFIHIQERVFNQLQEMRTRNKLIEDYFPLLSDDKTLDKLRLAENMRGQAMIALNNGFEAMKLV